MNPITMEPAPVPVQRAPRSLRARLLRFGVMSVIFLGGGVAGYCVGTMQLLEFDTTAGDVAKQPDKFTEYLLAHVKKDLSLSEEQYPQVERIFLRHHEAFDRMRKESQAAFAKEMAKMDVEMFGVLNETQAQLWKTRMERMRGRWHRPSSGGSSRRDKGNGKPDSERKPPDSRPAGDKDRRPESENPKSTPAPAREVQAKPAQSA